LSGDLNSENVNEIRGEVEFYAPGYNLIACHRLPLLAALSSHPVLFLSRFMKVNKRLKWYRGGVFDIDPKKNPQASANLVKLSVYCASEKVDLAGSRARFISYVDSLRKQQLDKAYVFGTGPSLERAEQVNWSDGYRIVCNTIVRDPVLWHHINPHFIVAGDALYHFSYTKFARCFREDLAKRLAETNTFFVYPVLFHQIVARELGQYADRLFPIPKSYHTDIHVDLTKEFCLPGLGNVLPSLLLPLACTLSKNVFLWGFDGRAPKDQLFWSNSSKHSYPELLPELVEAFPAFFKHLVPDDDPLKYVKSVHGDNLEMSLQDAENAGWGFHMMHESWTPTFQKRYIPSGN
jgi:heat shock protein HspQ